MPVLANPPALGSYCYVVPGAGVRLVNPANGAYYPTGVATQQVVTVPLLRYLNDGDLLLADANGNVVGESVVPGGFRALTDAELQNAATLAGSIVHAVAGSAVEAGTAPADPTLIYVVSPASTNVRGGMLLRWGDPTGATGATGWRFAFMPSEMALQGDGSASMLTAGQVATQLAAANVAKLAAEAARDAANVNGKVYASTVAGLAATTTGQYFSVPSATASEHLILYLNNAGAAVEQKRYLSAAGVQSALDSMSIAPARTTFIKPGKNKFDAASVGAPGSYIISTDGTVGANAAYVASGFIPVSPSTQYRLSFVRQMAFYTSAQVYISGSAPSAANTFTTPVNAAYMRLSVFTAEAATVQLELGAVSTAYEAYQLTLDTAYLAKIVTALITDRAVTTPKLSDGAVTPVKASFFSVGKNKYNQAEATSGFYILSTNGVPQASAAHAHSGYVPVLPSTEYTRNFTNQMAFYDANLAYISGIATSAGATVSQFTTPANAAYARFTISPATISTFQVELGAAATGYENYYFALSPEFLRVFTSAIPDGAVTTSKLPDGTITPAKTSFFSVGKNKFTSAEATAGFYILNSNGVPQAHATYVASGYVPVLPSTQYTRSYTNQMAFYDANKVYISGIATSDSAPSSFTTPANAAFARFTIAPGNLPTFQVELGAAATAYSTYKLVVDPAYQEAAAGSGQTVDDVILPIRTYVLVGSTGAGIEQANIYFDNVCQGYIGDKVVDAAASFGRQYAECWRLEPGNSATSHYNVSSGTVALTLAVRDRRLDTLKTAPTVITLVSKSANTPAVRLLCLGDSITRNGAYCKQVADKIGGVVLQGIRHYAADAITLNREGRGGWTLANYTGSFGLASGLDSPFMFPDGIAEANYRGNVEFWRKAVTLVGDYDTDGFQKIARGWADSGAFLYDTSTGYPTGPTTGWVVYDPAQAAGAKFREWNGSAWVTASAQPSTWSFDFAKYLTRFAAAFADGSPTHLSVLMGANDFQSTAPDDTSLAAFAAKINTIVASARAAVPGLKVIINLPTIGAPQDAWGISAGSGQVADGYRRNIQRLSRYLLTTYDTSAQESAGTHICSMLAVVDPVNGFDYLTEAASKYATAALIRRYNDFVHPNATVGHLQMGDALAAVVQATR